MITRKNIIESYINFFKSNGHKEIPNESLVPKNDPTVLFTTAGMHPLVPYLLGQKHPSGKNLVNVQRCIRTGDISKVGDEEYHTFFEMLGNWSLGDYWKKESIKLSLEFLTKILKIPKNKISITCFKGDKNAKKDTESAGIWKSLGISSNKIKFLGKEDNWWGPAGKTGPCGPCSEIFVNSFEIWNNVFMEYFKDEKNIYLPAKQKNVDTGMGVERTLTILNGLKDSYMTDIWKPIIKEIEHLSRRSYKKNKRTMRIIADHIKASVFIMGDGVTPSNTEQGYVLRRLIRRAIRYGKDLGIKNFTSKIAESIFKMYPDYSELNKNKKLILNELEKEENKFLNTLEKGLKKFNQLTKSKKILSGKDAFLLFQSYGFPIEMTLELAKDKNIKVNKRLIEQELKKHQQLSRTATSGKFKSGLSDYSEKTIRLHTATHLLNEALRKILGEEVKQRGSNINPERLRFDFSFNRKLTPQEIKKIESLINTEIKKGSKVIREEMPLKKALASGAQAEFGAKYPNIVSVYTIGSFSKEICTGPHINNTSELGHFKISKEESSAAGVRRIKAVLE